MEKRARLPSQAAIAEKHLVAHVVLSFHRVRMQTEKATFGAGCFWGVEENFRSVEGVLSTSVGYEGGTQENPTYQDVCTDKTGHAEVVEVEFDPSQVSYDELLDVFWSNHNPTTVNRQGPDVGVQYRSVIFIILLSNRPPPTLRNKDWRRAAGSIAQS